MRNKLIDYPSQNASRPRPSRQKAIQALREAIAERPEAEALFRLLWDYQARRPEVQHDDRATALVVGSIMEAGLEYGILTHCVELDDLERQKLFGSPQEASMSFDIKIRLGFALGLYGGDSRDDLTCIRHVRNVFAHARTDIRFNSSIVEDLCNHIKCIDKALWGGILGPKPTTARDKFIETVRHYFAWVAGAHNGGQPIRYVSYEFSDLYA